MGIHYLYMGIDLPDLIQCCIFFTEQFMTKFSKSIEIGIEIKIL